MDFMHDQSTDGRCYRLFNVIDDFNCEGLTIDMDFSLPAPRVIRALNQVIEWLGKPEKFAAIMSRNISHLLANWSKSRNVKLEFIQPEKPQKNAYIERFN